MVDASLDQQAGTQGTSGTPSQVAELQQQLADSNQLLAQIKARRAEELARLAEVTRARDLLEARAAAQMEKVNEALAELKLREKHITALEQRAGSGRLAPGDPEDGAEVSTQSAREASKDSFIKNAWFKQTVRMAEKAHRDRRLVDAQVLFDAALLVRQTPGLWTQLAHVLREQDLFDGAQAAYDHALKLQPSNAENMFLAGFCAEQAGRKQQAAKYYDAANAADPKLVDRYDHLRDFNARLFK